MPYQVHFRRWVLWWIYTGIVCGIVALVNILFRDLSSLQIAIVIGMGVLFWTVGGIVAYGYGGVRIVSGLPAAPGPEIRNSPQQEWHAASDFLLPGTRRTLLPPRH